MIAQPQDGKNQPGPQGAVEMDMIPPPAYPAPAAGSPHPYPQPQVGTPTSNVVYPQSDAARLGEQYRAELMAECAQGRHDRTTKFGVCGIITAILCFPIGLVALCIDNEERCARCGVRL